jgi:molybdopterin synthase catalytic subunit
MRIEVLHFAQIRELVGTPREYLDLPPGSTVSDGWEALLERHPDLRALGLMPLPTLDHTYGSWEAVLNEGAILSFLTPMGGG